MIVQDFIRQEGTQKLVDDYKIIIKRHARYPNLHMFRYNMIDSPLGVPLVQKCRGLILDADHDWEIVSYPYDKFFNYGEGHAAQIDWTTARVYEKLDGSLMTLYWYDGAWQIASSGMPDAAGNVNGDGSFADLWWETVQRLGYKFPTAGYLDGHAVTRFNFMFELMTKFNRVVVAHEKPRIVLHGARNLDTLTEQDPASFSHYGWEITRAHPLTSIEDVLTAAQVFRGVDGEGYVVRDGEFRRLKVKSPAYVALSHLKDGFGPRRILEIIRTGETSEVLVHFPEWRQEFEEIQQKYDALMARVEQDWQQHHGIMDRKEFALAVKDRPWSGALFARKQGKIASFKEWAQNMTIDNLETMLRAA